jgi:hypothetical protein
MENKSKQAYNVNELREVADDMGRGWPITMQEMCLALDDAERYQKLKARLPEPERLASALLDFSKDCELGEDLGYNDREPWATRRNIVRQLMRAAGLNPTNLDAFDNPLPMPTEVECVAAQAGDPLDRMPAALLEPREWTLGDIWLSTAGSIMTVVEIGSPEGKPAWAICTTEDGVRFLITQGFVPTGWTHVLDAKKRDAAIAEAAKPAPACCGNCKHWDIAGENAQARGWCPVFQCLTSRHCISPEHESMNCPYYSRA